MVASFEDSHASGGQSNENNRETVPRHDAGVRLSGGELQVESRDGEAPARPIQEKTEAAVREGEIGRRQAAGMRQHP